MSRDTFLLAAPITSQDPVQRCYLDLYGNTPHEPHPWAELTTPAPAGIVGFLNPSGTRTLTGYQCPGRQAPPGHMPWLYRMPSDAPLDVRGLFRNIPNG
jgi:hypothetical protein